MSYGFAKLAIIPIRAEGSDKAEIISQLLFGEHYEVLEEAEKWIRIRNHFDQYEGWICRKQFFEITGKEFDELGINDFPMCASLTGQVTLADENTNITRGAVLPYYHQGYIRIRDQRAKFTGDLNQTSADKIMEYALSYLNTPYLWGGRSPFGIDCSGFAQIVYKLCGYKLPRDAYQQAEHGYDVPFVETSEPGDLAFFDNAEGHITHVGIITEPGKIIHASGSVKIDLLDSEGIFDQELKRYTHKLRLIRRII
ncbi:C40 family peptidase [Parvicella tangerina]|uniref:Gamma-D-glutamyl-L-lysine dipeptidyl-peptidase n=1 Tax=Parvicella tangerina TaxID=2829795 RepID=A0A916NI20_9FLAO|nr:C40 family peptidase [Parvicella tangerina]CAG5082915.1 Gamma-D-glutamyl-L-lysine dipeptidyl-peptidase [Parvicella tangerina]